MNTIRVLVFVVSNLTLSISFWIALYIKKQTARPLGVLCRRVCAVPLQEIEVCCRTAAEGGAAVPPTWQGRINLIRILLGYIRPISINTLCFQEGSRFEVLKIEPGKSSLDYELRETLAVWIVEESTALRWVVIKVRMRLWKNLFLALCGRAINVEGLRQLFLKAALEYKGVEDSLLDMTGMGKDESLHRMLMERLGYSWKLYSSNAS